MKLKELPEKTPGEGRGRSEGSEHICSFNVEVEVGMKVRMNGLDKESA